MKQVIKIKGEQNRHNQNVLIVNRTFTAAKVIKMLIRQGFTILCVLVEKGKPEIWIQNCPCCKQLDGAWYRRTGDAAGTLYTMQVDLEGATVKWYSGSPTGAAL